MHFIITKTVKTVDSTQDRRLNFTPYDRIYEHENDGSVRIQIEIPEERILGYRELCDDDQQGVRFYPNPSFDRSKIGKDIIRDKLWHAVRNKCARSR